MQPTICSRCNKNVAILFIQKIENGKSLSEGLCLKCAKELGIKYVQDICDNMGITDEELEGISNEMMAAFEGVENLSDLSIEGGTEESGKTATFPFLDKLFGAQPSPGDAQKPGRESNKEKTGSTRGQKKVSGKLLYFPDKASTGR